MNVATDDPLRIHRVVWCILAQFPAGGTEPISNTAFMKEMQEIKKRNPKLFAGMVFSNRPIPWSIDLEQILFCMGAAKCLSRSPVDHRWYFHGVAGGFRELHARHFTQEELKVLEREGKDLAEKVARGELAPVRIS